MTRIAIAAACLLAVSASPATSGEAEETASPPIWPEPKVHLMILGTFHFDDAGLDSYRSEHDVDVRSPERQDELTSLLDSLATFRPTKIALEWPYAKQAALDDRYAAYRDGALDPSPSETDQVGLRLATALGHERVYAVDAKRRFYEPWVDPDEYAVEHGQEQLLAPDFEELYRAQHAFEDALKTRRTLTEHLLYLNSEKRTQLSHGQYVIGNIAVGDAEAYPGVDSKTPWYNRNLKIFANLLRIANPHGDRILLVIGSGHLAILRHAAQASPQIALVNVGEVLEPPERQP